LKYLIFDIDGTLTDTTKVDDECYINSFESLFGVSIQNVSCSDLNNVTDWGITEELVQLKLKRNIENHELLQLRTSFVKSLANALKNDDSRFQEIPGAINFFKKLFDYQNFALGIATGGWEESANLKLNHLGIDPYKFCYSNSNHFKTREAITLSVIDQLKNETLKPAKEIIYFGDGEWDFVTCQKLGIRFIGVDNKMNNKLSKLGAKEIYYNFSDVDTILRSIISDYK